MADDYVFTLSGKVDRTKADGTQQKYQEFSFAQHFEDPAELQEFQQSDVPAMLTAIVERLIQFGERHKARKAQGPR